MSAASMATSKMETKEMETPGVTKEGETTDNEVQCFLRDNNLAHYYDNFVSMGADTMEFLAEITLEDMTNEIGLKTLHARKLLHEIEKRAATTSSKMPASPLAAAPAAATAMVQGAMSNDSTGAASLAASFGAGAFGAGDASTFGDAADGAPPLFGFGTGAAYGGEGSDYAAPSFGYAACGESWASKSYKEKLAMIPSMVQNAMSKESTAQVKATTFFRKFLSIEKNPPIQQVINSGVVPCLVEFLKQNDKPSLQFEAAWALTNIVSGTSDHTRVVIEMGAIPVFVQLLSSANDDVCEQAVWALGNIAGDSPQCRDRVLQAGALQPLLKQLHSNAKLSMLRNGTWTLSKFCGGKPQPLFEWVSPALTTLGELIFQLDDEVVTDACWSLSYLTDGSNEKIAAVVESGVTMRLVELLMHPSPAIQTPALRAIGNIVTGNEMQTQIVINCSALPCLLPLLSSVKKGIKKEACWAISNITAGNKKQLQQVIDANLIPPVIHLLSHAEFDIKKEAAWAIANATTGGTSEQVEYLVSRGCIPPLCELLWCSDSNIVKAVCKAVGALVRKLSSNKKISAESGLSLMREFYFEHNCVEMLIVVKRLMPTKAGHLGIRDLMLEYLVGTSNVFRALA